LHFFQLSLFLRRCYLKAKKKGIWFTSKTTMNIHSRILSVSHVRPQSTLCTHSKESKRLEHNERQSLFYFLKGSEYLLVHGLSLVTKFGPYLDGRCVGFA
jgi:hypothetical protein